MIEVYKNIFVGAQTDYDLNPSQFLDWRVVHACKEPYHRNLLGYTGRAASKGHPQYLYGYDAYNHLVLNIVDAPNPSFFSDVMIDEAINYCLKGLKEGKKVLIHCNQGESRAPSIALLVLRKLGVVSKDFDIAVAEFLKVYPLYSPNKGIFEYIRNRWNTL